VYHSQEMVNRIVCGRSGIIRQVPALANSALVSIDCDLLFPERSFVGFQHNLNVGRWTGGFWLADRNPQRLLSELGRFGFDDIFLAALQRKPGVTDLVDVLRPGTSDASKTQLGLIGS
jgi:hypothetical protein